LQVFVPLSSSFQDSIATLDSKRLGKQRVECMQILATLRSENSGGGGLPVGWSRHPAVKMWKEYESALAVYMTMCVAEWEARGYKNNMVSPYSPKTFLRSGGWHQSQNLVEDGRNAELPPWWGREDVHASHRANLLRKDPDHYSQFGWTEAPVEGYVWPV
jgi:hypothetical protein